MKTKLIALLICLAAAAAAIQAQNNQTVSKPEKSQALNYADLATKLKNGDTKIDFLALRMAYTETKEYSPYGTGADETNPMFKAFGDKKYKDALRLADKILKENYVEMNAHYISSLANDALGNKEKATFHKEVFLGLINSIVAGKDGKSAKTAYGVISVPEEYVVLRTLGWQRGEQALITEDGHQFDVLTVKNLKTNEIVKMYFNIDTVFKAYGKIFGK